MATRYYSNAPATELNGGIDGSQTTLNVAAGGANEFPAAYPYTIIVDYGEPTEEVMDVQNRVSDTLTVVRGADNSTTFPHSSGAVVVHGVSARDHREANQHIDSSSGVHGITGSVVGTTDVQTLTNKTLGSNTALNNGTISDTGITGGTMGGTRIWNESIVRASESNALLPLLIKTAAGTDVGFVDRNGVIQGQRLRAINTDPASIPLVVRGAAGQTGLAMTVVDDSSLPLLQVANTGRTGIGDQPSDTAQLRVRVRNSENTTIQAWRKAGQTGFLFQAITETGGNLASISDSGTVQGTQLRSTETFSNLNLTNPGLVLGSTSGGSTNLAFSREDIHARSGTATGSTALWINRNGGDVNIVNSGGGKVRVPGAGQFKINNRGISIQSTAPGSPSNEDVWIQPNAGGTAVRSWNGSAWV